MTTTGEQFTITAGPYRAVVTESGASLRELTWQGLPLVLPHDADEVAPAALGQLLIPWPNRIDRGRYVWDGEPYQLDVSEPARDCAIHGLARWQRWTADEHGPGLLRMGCVLLGTPGYPFVLALRADYTLDADEGLTIRVTATNRGSRAAPYGHGAHPYLTVGRPIDECTVRLPAAEHLPVDDRMIPSGGTLPVDGTDYDLRAGRVLGAQSIDLAFTRLERDSGGRAWVRLSGGGRTTSLWLDEAHPWLEVYTADDVPADRRRMGLGAEPMTCPPNAFATGVDLVRLAPGDSFTGSWGIVAGEVP
ncbi:aldose 1-epimerase family protein [Nonomuraea sp. NPDC050663]|uniref:aldose 1-epimerase family protein n=1 Tax=Nonomuraea sp. NPDC050663 TaxID=3364370 RepID=UPI0037B7BF31